MASPEETSDKLLAAANDLANSITKTAVTVVAAITLLWFGQVQAACDRLLAKQYIPFLNSAEKIQRTRQTLRVALDKDGPYPKTSAGVKRDSPVEKRAAGPEENSIEP